MGVIYKPDLKFSPPVVFFLKPTKLLYQEKAP